jgi:hypothetical protein
MRIGRDDEYLEIEELERCPDTLPGAGDVKVKVTVRLQEFSGSYSGVWLAKRDLVRFVAQLQAVFDTRTGKANLEAMSPNVLAVELRPMNSRGYFEMSVRLGRHQYSGDTNWPTFVAGGFEIEPDELRSVLLAFKALLD